MSKIGDALREFAVECDGNPELQGVIFAKTGDLRIHLAHADTRITDRDGLNGLLAAAKQAATAETEQG